jgi:hypothetical protein
MGLSVVHAEKPLTSVQKLASASGAALFRVDPDGIVRCQFFFRVAQPKQSSRGGLHDDSKHFSMAQRTRN